MRVRERKKTFDAGGYTLGGLTARLRHKTAATAAQEEACPICGSAFTPDGMRQACVDSDASCEVRGVICNMCNRGIGLLGDDARCLLLAGQYLLEHEVTHDRARPGARSAHGILEKLLGPPRSRAGMVAMLAVSTKDIEMAQLATSHLASSWEAPGPK